MDYLLPVFKGVSLVFAIAAVGTGAQAIFDPAGFSKSFGLPPNTKMIDPIDALLDRDDTVAPKATAIPHQRRGSAMSYISLMGVRQLATGIILMTFAYQNKWAEMATILAIIGILVAGTDGVYLARAGATGQAKVHAVPGALIAALAGAVIYSNA